MKLIGIIILLTISISCKKNRLNVDVSNVDIELEVNRFDKFFFDKDADDITQLISEKYNNHNDFIDLYTEEIIKVGPITSDQFISNFNLFRQDSVIKRVADSVLFVFNDFSKIEKGLKDGFKHYNYYYPNKLIPKIYTYFSGFNQSLLVTENFIGVSLDKYIGSECVFYNYLGIPKYKIDNMKPEKIIPDIFYSWALTEFYYNNSINNLLSNMIYQGKLMYFIEAMNPKMDDVVIMGYSEKQIKWCEKNEAIMWAYLVEKRLLYSEERLNLQTFIGDSPFTKAFSLESPGRTGIWIGWQIIRSYMNSHEEISLNSLMTMNNAQEILKNSNYFPD